MTYETRLIAGLLSMGWRQDKLAGTRKYKVFGQSGKPEKVFVGPSGALRFGWSVASSYSLGCPGNEKPGGMYAKVLARGDAAMAAVRAEVASGSVRQEGAAVNHSDPRCDCGLGCAPGECIGAHNFFLSGRCHWLAGGCGHAWNERRAAELRAAYAEFINAGIQKEIKP